MRKKATLKDLMNKYRNGDISARDEIFNRYKEIAEKIAKQYENCGIEYEEILQQAYMGVLEAIEKYKDLEVVNLPSKIAWNINLMIKDLLLPPLDAHMINKEKIIKVLFVIKKLRESK